MSTKDAAIEVFDSSPCRSLLRGVEQLPYGRRVLNWLCPLRGVYTTFEEGWAVARKATYGGHDHPDAIKLHFDLSRTLRASDYAALYWMSRIGCEDRRLAIFDFGGNAGNLYYSYWRYLATACAQFTWTVFDLPQVVQAGCHIAAERGVASLKFTDSFAGAAGSNVLLASGSLHYWEGSPRTLFNRLPELPKHVILNRNPTHATASQFVTVQFTASYAVPCVVRNTDELISSFKEVGYTLVDSWPVFDLRLRMPLFPTRTIPHYTGFYFRRSDASAC